MFDYYLLMGMPWVELICQVSLDEVQHSMRMLKMTIRGGGKYLTYIYCCSGVLNVFPVRRYYRECSELSRVINE